MSAHKAGIVDAQLALGQLALDQGDHAAAIDWFRAAARSGDRRAYNMLGRCFEHGWGTAADALKASVYYRHAADLGDAWAMFNLADLLLRGKGADRDEGQAFDLYVEATRLGHIKSLNMIGLFYEKGHFVEADKSQARAFYLAGAEGGDCWAQFNHARLLIEDGNIANALPWLEKTFESGFPDFWASMGEALSVHSDRRLLAMARRALSSVRSCIKEARS
ncbi:MAG TPA: tetratricopeptide repeat protein [Rhizobium sp.]